jgi:hypothetical protein
MTLEEFEEWSTIEENGMLKSKELGPYRLSLRYLPSKSGELQSFVFRISSLKSGTGVMELGNQSKDDFALKLNYFSYIIQQDFILVEGADTLLCVNSHFEYLNNLTPYVDFNVQFPKSKHKNTISKKFIFDAQKLGLGFVKLIIEKKHLDNIPTLQI